MLERNDSSSVEPLLLRVSGASGSPGSIGDSMGGLVRSAQTDWLGGVDGLVG